MIFKGKKIAIIGAGNVGATIAYTLTLAGAAADIVLVDVNHDKAEGEARDILQGTAFCPPVNLYAGDYPDLANSDIVIITAGLGRKPGQDRIDLCKTNIEIIRQVIPEVVKYAPNSIYVVVSNPADILTYAVLKLSGIPANRIIGSGTVLDSARLRTEIAATLGDVNIHDIQAYVLGEHGESSMVPWSLTSIAGMDLVTYCQRNNMTHCCEEPVLQKIEGNMRAGGAEVIKRKGATFYAIALSVRRICEAILRDTDSILTVASYLNGEYGIYDVCLSLPYVVGASGIKHKIELEMTDREVELLQKSGAALRSVLDKLSF